MLVFVCHHFQYIQMLHSLSRFSSGIWSIEVSFPRYTYPSRSIAKLKFVGLAKASSIAFSMFSGWINGVAYPKKNCLIIQVKLKRNFEKLTFCC